ncbi:TPA: ead/Ea22-like family protein [Klebsiella pneumoniae]
MTTDITELAQRMKAAAEKATKGLWVTFDDDWSDDEDVVVTNEARDSDCVSPIAVIKCGGSESDDDSPYCAEQRANAAFIALANPANILALVEALEKAQRANNSAPAILRLLAEEKQRRGEVAAATAFNYAASALQKELSK